MIASNGLKIFTKLFLLLLFVVGLSHVSTLIWDKKKETLPEDKALSITQSMTVAEFGAANDIPDRVLGKLFGLIDKSQFEASLGHYGISAETLQQRVDRELAIEAEHESKNWVQVFLKFGLWILFLSVAFVMIRKGRVNPRTRKILYLIALTIFGIILGADPSAMGTVKDAVVLYAKKGAVFPPRLIALAVFLIMVVVANKLFCSWGCQLGTLQDLAFRFNRSKKDRKGLIRQYKLPFVFSNGIRILFFLFFLYVVGVWNVDLFEEIDPFKIFKPAAITAFGWMFLTALFAAGIFVYRPWCTLFCPFGLVGWLFEKLAFFKIKVQYDTCIACESCARACPTTTMEAILKRETKTVPDCFACSNCVDACPTRSISFATGKREMPPADKYKKRKK